MSKHQKHGRGFVRWHDECQTEGCAYPVRPDKGHRYCPGCETGETETTLGWAIFNEPLGNGWFEVQKFDESDLFRSDEDAATVHFRQWQHHRVMEEDVVVRVCVIARGPKTDEARTEVARFDEKEVQS